MLTWLNEPAEWAGDAADLTLVTAKGSDFWRTTFYGFTRDNGHCLLSPVSGDFSASLTVTADYAELYDQAGMMLRIGAQYWIKAGIEYTDGLMHFSTVVTNGISDWSVIPLPEATPQTPVSIRITRHDDAVRIQFHLGDGHWQMARLSPFPADAATIGPMACTPERAGLKVHFRDFTIGPAISRALHD
ncbi:DUF1349 domain-containing protein [Martelella sp. HB161492]|uniref:DUF1349 domain-containing protein n=1 Tax=Martelella sp. HB161492 TaxID=2720726 RepID=UPI0015903E7B|nr:DUF1349 domain-containing protein [Martelella sp. HB161492]